MQWAERAKGNSAWENASNLSSILVAPANALESLPRQHFSLLSPMLLHAAVRKQIPRVRNQMIEAVQTLDIYSGSGSAWE
jgi:hypothetical protein